MNKATNSGKGTRRPFIKEEAELIITLVEKYKLNKYKNMWVSIIEEFNAKNINGKRGFRAIRGRWRDHLNPHISSNSPFSSEEDELLLKKVYEIGEHWRLITKFFPNRSMDKLKNRYIELSKNKSTKRSYTQNELNAIKELIKDNPEKLDPELAKEFNKNSPFGKRSVCSLSIKINKLRNTLNISNSQNLTVNQNNLPQRNQNVSEKHDNFFQFDNDKDDFFNQDDIPELGDYDFEFDDFSF